MKIYACMLALSLLLMLPLFLIFRPGTANTRNRRDAALTLHRAQLTELDRDLADARIAPAEYQAAKLEIERRLLAADAFIDPNWNGNARLLLITTVLFIPIVAFALYLPGSTPNLPSEPHTQWVARQQAMSIRLAGLITAIRMRLANDDPNSVDASQGEAYLAEALSEQAGAVTPEALSYFKQSLANAPANASWRPLDEARIAQATQN
jgi:cytochrome c-type biogenesis protein CcmH